MMPPLPYIALSMNSCVFWPCALAAPVELLRELLALARRADVDAHLHGERDWRAERLNCGLVLPKRGLTS